MSLRRAPTALRMPISRVRSVTLTSMMFITPMPPTSSEMAATSPSSVVNTLLVEVEAARIEPWLITLEVGVQRAGDAVPLIEDRGDLALGRVQRARATSPAR